jgi:DNA mismatch repair protein MutL
LSPQLANQIAAGEVVERPASVVKELLENSVDAGATVVLIEIEQGGQKRILIRDNGAGIAKEELALALSRHATSKISNIDDLEHITSMGFRGEALASISSVSRLNLTSKPSAQAQAWQACAEGKQMQVELTPVAHPDGTSIEVLDLFFNTPARRKFLRSGKTEFQHIENIVKRIALTRPDVQFELKHNQKLCCRYPRVKDIAKRIEQVCGKNMLLNCTPIDYSFDGMVLSGYCSKLGHGVATRDSQYTFVNGRMVKDKLLAHALRQVYEDTLPPQTFASYVLYLQVSPQQIDVNVHPSKHEVRFHQSRQVHDLVFKAVNDAISYSADNAATSSKNVLEAPSHNYIQTLSPVRSDSVNKDGMSTNFVNNGYSDTQGSRLQSPLGLTKSSQHRSNVPARKEIKANHDFYAGIDLPSSSQHRSPTVEPTKATQQNQAAHSNEGQNEQHRQLASPSLSMHHYLYNSPYVVLARGENLDVLPISKLLATIVKIRILDSTIAQPLLMPVSVENKLSIKQAQLDSFANLNMLMSASHQKLILKQVPCELRQLPWASIFPQLVSAVMIAHKNDADILASTIALAWLRSLEVTSSMLNGWMSELGAQQLQTLCEKDAKSLHLSTWMSPDK